MGWLTLVGQAFKIILFFLNLWKEKDEDKAKQKAVIGREIVNAVKETDPKVRASRLNIAVGHIKRV